jgi:hypothetical protein
MRRVFLAAFLLIAGLTGPTGCSSPVQVKVSEKWSDEVIAHIVRWIEDGTGIDIEKGDVTVESLGAHKAASGGAYISDFKVTVNYRQTKFTSTPKDIPCTTDGVPTEEGNRRIKEAVEEIKVAIRASR